MRRARSDTVIPLVRNVRNRQIQRYKVEEWLLGAEEGGLEMGVFWWVMKVFHNYTEVTCTTPEHTKTSLNCIL